MILIAGARELSLLPYNRSDDRIEVFVVRHTWHTGIIIPKDRISGDYNTLKQTFPEADFLEFGWGDHDFFRSDKATFSMAARAILWPTRSVIHVMPYYRGPYLYFPKDRIFKIIFTKTSFFKLLERIDSSLYKGETGDLTPISADNPLGGCFYRSNEKYYLFKTCNVWTAQVLRFWAQ